MNHCVRELLNHAWFTSLHFHQTTMVRKRNKIAAENEALIQQALQGIVNGTYKSAYEASQKIGANQFTIYDRLGDRKSRQPAVAHPS